MNSSMIKLCMGFFLFYSYNYLFGQGIPPDTAFKPTVREEKESSKVESNIQPRTVTLTFREKGTGKPLSRVRTTVGEQSFFSDKSGKISIIIDSRSPPQYSFRKSGYKPLNMNTKEITMKDVYLIPDIVPNLVIVRSKRKKSISKSTVSVDEAKAIAPRGDPLQVTTFLPGVKASSFNPRLVVRGSAPQDSKYYIDGVEVPFIYHTIGGISVIPGELIREVDFYAGGFSSQYGNATGGIVEVTTKGNNIDRNLSQFTVNIPIFSGFYNQGVIDDQQTYSFSARRSYLDSILPSITEDATVIPSFYDSHFSYSLQRENGESKLLVLSASDGLELKLPNSDFSDDSGSAAFNIYTYFGTVGYTHTLELKNRAKISATPQIRYTRVRNNILDNYVRIKGREYKLPFSWIKRLGKDKITVGVEASTNRATIDVRAPKFDPDDPFFDFEEAEVEQTEVEFVSNGYAAWLEYDLNLNPLRILPGLRINQFVMAQSTEIDPRVMISYDLTKNMTIKASGGKYSQQPQPQEMDDSFGNPDLTPNIFNHYIVALQNDWGNGWDSDLQLFQKLGRNLVKSSPVDNFSNSGSARTYGLELLIRRQDQGKWFGWFSYAYSKAEEQLVHQGKWFPSEYDQTHNLNLVGNYRWTKQWSSGARLNYHTGDRFTPVSEAVYNSGLNKYQPRYQAEDRFKGNLPDYHQLDIFTTYEKLFNTTKLIYQFGIEYLAFNRPAYGVEYNYDYRKKQYVTGIPPIPYIQITGEF